MFEQNQTRPAITAASSRRTGVSALNSASESPVLAARTSPFHPPQLTTRSPSSLTQVHDWPTARRWPAWLAHALQSVLPAVLRIDGT